MIELQEFAKVMGLLAAAFPRFDLTPATIEAYYLILSDLDLDLLKVAVLDLASADSPWFPSAGQIRSAAFRLIDEGEDRPTGADAWGIVMREVRRCGWYESPDFGNDLIKRAVEGIGGWRLLCVSQEDTLHTTRARFIDAYNVIDERVRHRVRMLPEVRRVVDRLAAPDNRALEDGRDNA